MLYAQSVGLAKNAAYPLKPPSSQATRSHSGKARNYGPKALNETMLLMRRKKSFTISHPNTGYHQRFNQRERMGTEKRRPTPRARKN